MADWREAPRATAPAANIILPDALATSFFLKRRGVGKLTCSDAEVETIVSNWLDSGGHVDARTPTFTDDKTCKRGLGQRKLKGSQGTSISLLQAASLCGRESTLELLLQRGAAVDLQDYHGFTALHHAVSPAFAGSQRERVRIVRLLLEAGACPLIQDLYEARECSSIGETGFASDWARDNVGKEAGHFVQYDYRPEHAAHDEPTPAREVLHMICKAQDQWGQFLEPTMLVPDEEVEHSKVAIPEHVRRVVLPSYVATAVREGNELPVMEWLDSGGHVNARFPLSSDPQMSLYTMLMFACLWNQERIVVLLLSRGASPDLQCSAGCTALTMAAFGGSLALVQRLLQAGARTELRARDQGMHFTGRGMRTALLAAVCGAELGAMAGPGAGLQKAVIHLLRRYDTAVLAREQPTRHPGPDAEELVPEDVAKAANDGDTATVMQWLDSGGDINMRAEGAMTLLSIACHAGHHSLVATLLDRGADCAVQNVLGVSTLTFAVAGGQPSVVSLLLDANVPLNTVSLHGESALDVAMTLNDPGGIVQMLCDHGCTLASHIESDGTPARGQSTCSYCLGTARLTDPAKPLPPLMKCASCKVTVYCSRECQKADWKRHRKVCSALQAGRVVRLGERSERRRERSDRGDHRRAG